MVDSATNPRPFDRDGDDYIAISPLLLFPQTRGEFEVYIKLGERMILYADPQEPFTTRQRRTLHQNGVRELYVPSRHRQFFRKYLEDNLGGVLLDDSVPIEERSKVFYDVSVSIVKEALHSRLPESMDQARFARIERFVRTGIQFLLKGGSVKSVAGLISHDYYTYSHCVHVFVFTTAMLNTYQVPEADLINWGVGAVLHDIGKIQISRDILNKPGPLSPSELEMVRTHPVRGVALCAQANLPQSAINAILFHHEKEDGSGYPSQMKGSELPLPVKVIGTADVYDALTSERPYASGLSPYQALTMMRDQMPGHFHPEVLKRLIMVLSGAEIIEV